MTHIKNMWYTNTGMAIVSHTMPELLRRHCSDAGAFLFRCDFRSGTAEINQSAAAAAGAHGGGTSKIIITYSILIFNFFAVIFEKIWFFFGFFDFSGVGVTMRKSTYVAVRIFAVVY